MILCLFVGMTVLNEYVIYKLRPALSWPRVICNATEKCTKILLVADPQILGEYQEHFFARYDSDR